jgi:hypothetical protein
MLNFTQDHVGIIARASLKLFESCLFDDSEAWRTSYSGCNSAGLIIQPVNFCTRND